MSKRDGVDISKGQVGADISNNTDGVSALLASGPAPANLALGVTAKLTRVKDAEALGIDASYDNANNVRVYRHITEFYRMAGGDGQVLYIMLYPQTVTPADALDATYAQKLIADAKGDIKLFGLAWNPPSDYVSSSTDGMASAIRTAIPALQTFADWTDSTFRAVHTIIEGYGISGDASAALDLTAISVSGYPVQYPQVTVAIAQDWDYADTLDDIGKKYADIGSLMGAFAGRQVNESPAEVGAVNLTDTKKSKWLTAGISSHVKVADIEADLNQWATKGYCLAWDYQSQAVSGYRFSGDPVCAPVVEDQDGNLNESSATISRTNIAVRRALRDAYLPKINSVQQIDTATGLLPIGRIRALEGIGNDVFARMANDGKISGGLVKVDPNSNLLSGSKTLSVSFTWVPEGTIGEINGVVNIKSTLS